MPVEVPVLIIGGGGAGLSSSMLLTTYGVDSLLVSSLPSTSILPKAHVLNQRTMEIFTEVGVAPAIYERSTPAENLVATGFYAGVAGDRPHHGREIGRLEIWGAGHTDPEYIDASPCRTANLPQVRLEPVLRDHAEALAPGTIRFHHELVALEQDADGVTSTILDKDSGDRYEVRSKYVIGADGGRTVGRLVGLELDGQRDILDMVSVHMTVDLSSVLTDDTIFLRWLANPDVGGTFAGGILCPMGPETWGTGSEEWVFHLGYPSGDSDAGDREKVLARMRTVLGLPDLDPEVHAISVWRMEGVIAERFRAGRTFLVGDAAHRHPPTGGLGLNSAVHDAQNLCWKIAQVLAGNAGDGLLDTYDTERRPIDQRNITNSIDSTMARFRLDAALGLSMENTADQNWANIEVVWDETHPDHARRAQELTNAVAAQSLEFHHHNLEFGYTYTSTAIVDDGSPEQVLIDPIRLYQSTSRPGHPLPHAFVTRLGDVHPLQNETHGGRFLLVAGEDGGAWVEAARKVAAETGVAMEAFTLGADDAEVVDTRLAWLRKREIGRGGAVLVRPDRYIAFRSMGAVDDSHAVLGHALRSILSTGTDA